VTARRNRPPLSDGKAGAAVDALAVTVPEAALRVVLLDGLRVSLPPTAHGRGSVLPAVTASAASSVELLARPEGIEGVPCETATTPAHTGVACAFLKRDHALAELRVGGPNVSAFHPDLIVLARLAQALARERVFSKAT
jgi:hypothetical protein